MKLDATAILLAGGQSTRMGRDKALLPWRGVTLLQHVHAQLVEHFQEVVVASGAASRYAALGLTGVDDSPAAEGPVAGIIAALEVATHPICYLHPCDVPDVNSEVLAALFAALSPAHDAAVVAEHGRTHPMCALYRRDAALAAFRGCASENKFAVHAALARLRVVVVESAIALPNLNTREDVLAAGGELSGQNG